MSNALEIRSRTQVVNAKITYAVEVQSVLRDLLTEVRKSYGGCDLYLLTIHETTHKILLVFDSPYGTDHYRLDRSRSRTGTSIITLGLFPGPIRGDEPYIGFYSGRARTRRTLFWQARP